MDFKESLFVGEILPSGRFSTHDYWFSETAQLRVPPEEFNELLQGEWVEIRDQNR